MTRQALLLLALATVLVTGCNRSASQPPPQGNVATDVAATLAAVPTVGLAATRPPTATLPPSSTPAATITLAPSETPTLGPSPSPTAPALPPGDPRTGLNLSVPDYSDGFSPPSRWYTFSDRTVSLTQQNGTLTAVDKLPDTYVTWSTTNADGAVVYDVYAEVTAAIQACTGRDAAGMGVRIGGDAYDRGYALEVSCDGAYRIRKFINLDTPVVVLVDWTASEAILKGPHATNRLGLLAQGDTLSAFANNTLLGQTQDKDIVAGVFGLYASAATTPDTTVVFDDFALWYP